MLPIYYDSCGQPNHVHCHTGSVEVLSMISNPLSMAGSIGLATNVYGIRRREALASDPRYGTTYLRSTPLNKVEAI